MDKEMVKAIRLYLNKTQADFAEFLGVSVSYIGRVEIGDLRVNPKLKAKIISRFDMNDDFFAFYETMRRIT
ncbi:helix-turn-helix domain-containing protein [Fictibacillus terranigra]|uniref:Helix-turn-helix transcriptional regulator n=1 Tax=Fictibacillus terranigra TaxID=3058424 RepID=A0ABT8E6W1_9BACL|nr:helix-turn-helix transcriptional regulator [Fictibacillus sp. CENA-BCM004]MDN4073630.1 helix-turn-helix transcriptional regulator [Fictibacillus sp. CENA-BCM004]